MLIRNFASLVPGSKCPNPVQTPGSSSCTFEKSPVLTCELETLLPADCTRSRDALISRVNHLHLPLRPSDPESPSRHPIQPITTFPSPQPPNATSSRSPFLSYRIAHRPTIHNRSDALLPSRRYGDPICCSCWDAVSVVRWSRDCDVGVQCFFSSVEGVSGTDGCEGYDVVEDVGGGWEAGEYD